MLGVVSELRATHATSLLGHHSLLGLSHLLEGLNFTDSAVLQARFLIRAQLLGAVVLHAVDEA